MQFRSVLTIAAGLTVASGAAAAVFALMFGDVRVFTPAFAIIAVVAVCLGLPVYLAARAARNDTPRVAGVMGFVVGAVIPAILVFASAPDQASVGGTATVIDGSYTFAGSYLLYKLTDALIPMRVPAEHERVGLDLSQHGESLILTNDVGV